MTADYIDMTPSVSTVKINISDGDTDITARVYLDDLTLALNDLDGYLDDWLLEKLTKMVECHFDNTPEMTDEDLNKFESILEAMLG